MTAPVVIIFARIPRLGVGKRRLACSIGDRAALRLSTAMLHGLLRRLRGLRGVVRIIAATPDHHAKLRTAGFARVPQGTGNLGARMDRAFRRHPRRRVVLIGSDIPDIVAADIRSALRALAGADAVFGPAEDGGYWLVGMAGRRPAKPFARVRWSGPHALADTTVNFQHHHITLTRTLADLDEIQPIR